MVATRVSDVEAKSRVDVVVVGGGPAGSTAAYELAGSHEVLVVDKYSFPRDKACGGALVCCRDWPAEFPNYAEIESKLRGFSTEHVCLHFDKTPWWESSGTHFFDQVHRRDYDDLLLRAALDKPGVYFRTFQVRSVTRSRDGMIRLSDGKHVIEARAVIGADGANSVVSRALGNPPWRENEAGACCEVHVVGEKPHQRCHVFYLWDGAPGYGWIFCTAEGYNVGVGYIGEARKRVRQYLDELLAYGIEEGLLPRQHKIARSCGALAPVKVVDRIADDRILLAGDAAGLINQLSGEGIYYAMKSGQLAGRILADGFEHAASRYREAIKPVQREITYLDPIRPALFGHILSGYFGLTQKSAAIGLDGYLKAPFLNRFCHRQRLSTGSHYEKLRG